MVIVTGVSGAGKSTALRALEESSSTASTTCPLPLSAQDRRSPAPSRDEVSRAALAIDARSGRLPGRHLERASSRLARGGHRLEVLFLDASDEVLLRRFSETRRRHPLSGKDIRAASGRERELLAAMRERPTAVVDTGELNVHSLRAIIQDRYGGAGAIWR